MSSASSWMGIVSLILFLGLMSGFWIGITGLWKARRGTAWWLMAIGGIALPGLLMAGLLLIPLGLLLFSVGFALHGFAAAHTANRAGELEQLTAAMSEEINRLREGGPLA